MNAKPASAEPGIVTFFTIVYATALVIAPIIGIYTYFIRAEMNTYRTKGIEISANVGDIYETRHRRYTTYDAEVTFFTEEKEGEFMGDFVSTTITRFLNEKTVDDLMAEEQILYLPDDPEKAAFKKSLDPAYYSNTQKWSTTIYLAITALVAYLCLLVARKMTKA